MKRSILKYLLLFAVCFYSTKAFSDEGYKIQVKIKGLKNADCILAYHYGASQYVKDSARTNEQGEMVFTGEEKLPGGIYMIVLPSKKYFEIIVNEQSFSIETDTLDMVKNFKVKGSVENQLFYDYLNYIVPRGTEMEASSKLLDKVKNNQDSVQLVKNRMSEIEKEIEAHKTGVINKNPDLLISKIFRAMTEPRVPESASTQDPNFAFTYYRDHFFDNIDFSDERLLYTPIFHNKLKQYITKLIAQHPDSINKAADYIVSKASSNKEVFKYVVVFITNHYETSNIMGMDGVFVHMTEKYYMTGKAFWVDSAQAFRIKDKAMRIKPNIIGKKAPALILKDPTGKVVNLQSLSAKYFVLYFYSPECGHCKKTTPKIVELHNKFKANQVQVVAVTIDPEPETTLDKWKAYTVESGLSNVINLADLKYQSNFRYEYNIESTPVIYLLDDKKAIIAKKLGVEQLEEFLTHLLSEKASSK